MLRCPQTKATARLKQAPGGKKGTLSLASQGQGETLIELIWTITPALILIAIAFPSFRLLYLLDEVISPTITIKVVGHQWYWSYEYSDYVNESGESIEFDSYMIPESDLELGQFRLLDVDNKVIVPVDTHIRLIVTGSIMCPNYIS